MQLDQAGIDFLKDREGFVSVATGDIGGVLTLGYGFTKAVLPDLKEGDTMSTSEGEQVLREVVKQFEKCVDNSVRMPISQNQFNALVSLCYNIGEANFLGSTVLRKLNEGDYRAAGEAFELWVKVRIDGELKVVNGLVNRRKLEREMFERMMINPETDAVGSKKSAIKAGPVAKEAATDRRLYKTTEFGVGVGTTIMLIVNHFTGINLPPEVVDSIVGLAQILIGGRLGQKALSAIFNRKE